MEQHGSTSTYNMESVLRQNIVSSEYFRSSCAQLNSWDECVDMIYDDVYHVEPWMSGNARGASSAFCLLYRLMQLKITAGQVRQLLDHADSVYIRAVSAGRPCQGGMLCCHFLGCMPESCRILHTRASRGCKATAVEVSRLCAQYACSGFAMWRASQSPGVYLQKRSQPAAQCMPGPDLVCLPLQIGLLYLRYVGEPKSLWQDWLSHYMYDDQVRQSESLGAAIAVCPISCSRQTLNFTLPGSINSLVPV